MVSPANFAGKKAQVIKLTDEQIKNAVNVSQVSTIEYEHQLMKQKREARNFVVSVENLYNTNSCRFCETEYIPQSYSNQSPPICSKECLNGYVLLLKHYRLPFNCKMCSRANVLTEAFYDNLCSLGCVRKAVLSTNFDISFNNGKILPASPLKNPLDAEQINAAKNLLITATSADLRWGGKLKKQILNGEDYNRIVGVELDLGKYVETFQPNKSHGQGTLISVPKLKNQAFVANTNEEATANEKYITETYNNKIFTPAKFKERVTQDNLRKVKERAKQKSHQDFLCPNPYKKMYKTITEASQFIRDNHPGDNKLRPYNCRCGTIHIGHDKKTNTNNPETQPRAITQDKQRQQKIHNIHTASQSNSKNT